MATNSNKVSKEVDTSIPKGDETTKSFPPSHILEDGRFIYLPQPAHAERSKFFERSIARHGLLQADIMKAQTNPQQSGKQQKSASKDNSKKDSTTSSSTAGAPAAAAPAAASKKKSKQQQAPQLHPLAVASARLQASGIMELNRSINLSGLVSTGEYFGLSNVVDPSLEIPTASTSATDAATGGGGGSSSTAAAAVAKVSVVSSGSSGVAGSGGGTVQMEVQEEQRIRALYVCKRKRDQFEKAAQVLERHERRLAAALAAQAVVDQRLVRLRPQWRLVAPEHGTRAKPHPVRPTEVVAIDVDVYDRDRMGTSSYSSSSTSHTNQASSASALGRIARRVPRYATLELKDDYRTAEDLAAWKNRFDLKTGGARDDMDIDDSHKREQQPQPKKKVGKTRAEPFAVADPTLGNIDVDFDPNKVPMLTLQFDIEKTSTGFCQSATLSPLNTISTDGEKRMGSSYQVDETVVVALQHSLFCASLFESIRREVACDLDESDVGRLLQKTQKAIVTSAAMAGTTTTTTPAAWLASESDENFLPPPSLMVGAHGIKALSSLCVVHCHEGEVKVQLDCEYSLTVKLVEAGTASNGEAMNTTTLSSYDGMSSNKTVTPSGSHSPEQLLALCRALLLHSQDVYHRHSVVHRSKLLLAAEKKESAPAGLDRIKKLDPITSPRILQSCVSLGSKILFERRIRRVLARARHWLRSTLHSEDTFHVDWLPLSFFDFHSHFTINFRWLVLDVEISRDEMTVTTVSDEGEYRKVDFHSDTEFEIFLKMEIRRALLER